MKVVNGLAYIAADQSGGLQILDVSNPAAPQYRGMLDTPGTANGLAVSNGRVYLADGGSNSALLVIDVNNPAAPALVASLSLPASDARVDVVGGTAFVAAGAPGGLKIADISNPLAPVLRGSLATAAGAARAGGGRYRLHRGWRARLAVGQRQQPGDAHDAGSPGHLRCGERGRGRWYGGVRGHRPRHGSRHGEQPQLPGTPG
ncbi:MAG: hypothetical protein HZY76_21680 [Anaerolineae bacterium]|nr:MAG: hypothetical protein HZY76_21680 [Anaerolineae bacterium]